MFIHLIALFIRWIKDTVEIIDTRPDHSENVKQQSRNAKINYSENWLN